MLLSVTLFISVGKVISITANLNSPCKLISSPCQENFEVDQSVIFKSVPWCKWMKLRLMRRKGNIMVQKAGSALSHDCLWFLPLQKANLFSFVIFSLTRFSVRTNQNVCWRISCWFVKNFKDFIGDRLFVTLVKRYVYFGESNIITKIKLWTSNSFQETFCS